VEEKPSACELSLTLIFCCS